MKNRSKFLTVFLVILAGVVLYSLFDRMVVHREMYFKASYTDRTFVDLMERLIKEGVFSSDGEKVLMNEELLKNKGLKKITEDRVRNSLSFLYVKKGQITFDRHSASIANSRTFTDERVIRGRFLDRSGLVLAWSDIDERAWKQERKYAYGPQFYHIIGHWSHVFGKGVWRENWMTISAAKAIHPYIEKLQTPSRISSWGMIFHSPWSRMCRGEHMSFWVR